MRKLLLAATALSALLLAGCSKPVSVSQTSYGAISDPGSGEVDWERIYRNQNMLLSKWCLKECDKGYVYQLPITKVDYDGDYAIPLSNKLDLTIGSTLTFSFNREGGKETIVKRLQTISNKYQPKVHGSPTDNQIFVWDIDQIVSFDLPDSKYKSIVRSILSPKEITEAYDELAAQGQLAVDIEDAVRQHLEDNDSVLKLVRLEFHTIDLPDEVKQKNTQEYNLDAQERIQKRQLAMKRARVKERHLLNLEELQNDVELVELMRPVLDKNVLAYKWIQTANTFAESGIPMAITPEMLNPAVEQVVGESFDMTRFMQKLEARKAEVENQVKVEQACAESIDGCDNQ